MGKVNFFSVIVQSLKETFLIIVLMDKENTLLILFVSKVIGKRINYIQS
jgi:hypothetical protein